MEATFDSRPSKKLATPLPWSYVVERLVDLMPTVSIHPDSLDPCRGRCHDPHVCRERRVTTDRVYRSMVAMETVGIRSDTTFHYIGPRKRVLASWMVGRSECRSIQVHLVSGGVFRCWLSTCCSSESCHPVPSPVRPWPLSMRSASCL